MQTSQIDQQTRYLTIKEVRALFVTKPTLKTIRWWMKTGMHNWRGTERPGERIRLRYVREGGSLLTTIDWVADFKLACSLNTKGGRG